MKFVRTYYWAIIPFLSWIIVRYGFGFTGAFGQDAYAYLLYGREMTDLILNATPSGYFFWPANYPLLIGLLAIVLKSHFLAGQLISVASFSGVAYFIHRLLRRVFNLSESMAIGYVMLTFLFSPYMFRLSSQIMSDMLAMFLITGSFYYLIIFGREKNVRTGILWTIFTGLATTTRYPSGVVLLLPSIYMLIMLLRGRNWKLLSIMVLIGAIILFPAIWWKWEMMAKHANSVSFDGILDWRFSNYFKSGFLRRDGQSHYFLPNILFNFSLFIHPGTVFFGVALLPFIMGSVRKYTVFAVILFSVILYSLFLSGIPFQNSRVMTFTFPLVVILYAPGYRVLVDKIRAMNINLKWVFSIALIIQAGLCARAMKPSVLSQRMDLELVDHINKEHPGKTVYTFAFSQIFDAYRTGNPVVNTFNIEQLEFHKDAVYIFNPDLIDTKLAGTMPHTNWVKANSRMTLTNTKCWPDGWCVYSMNEK